MFEVLGFFFLVGVVGVGRDVVVEFGVILDVVVGGDVILIIEGFSGFVVVVGLLFIENIEILF